MPFDIDVPNGGGAAGPFIQWQAKESTDGAIPGRSWTLRDADSKTAFKGFDGGCVLDIENMRTGWCYSAGIKGTAPEWLWNASLKQFAPMPPARPGDTSWKRGFSIPLAYSAKDTAVWEQAQAGAWSAFVALAGLLKVANPPAGKLPVVRQNGVEKIESKRGITFAPKLEIVKWVDRPDALLATASIAADDDSIPF